MLGDAGNNVFALILVKLRNPFNRQVIRLRCTAGKDYFLRRRVDETRDLTPSFIYRRLGLPAK